MPSETKRKNCREKYAAGGASAIRNTVVSAGFQPLWGVKTGTLPRNRLAFSATGDANFHGVHEFVPVASMEKMVQVLVELVRC